MSDRSILGHGMYEREDARQVFRMVLVTKGITGRRIVVSDERTIQETVSRCVSIMVLYYNCGPKEKATREMIHEVQAVAEEVAKYSMGLNDVVNRILHPVEAELFVRYGHELGARMNTQFLAAFEGNGTPCGTTSAGPVKGRNSRPTRS